MLTCKKYSSKFPNFSANSLFWTKLKRVSSVNTNCFKDILMAIPKKKAQLNLNTKLIGINQPNAYNHNRQLYSHVQLSVWTIVIIISNEEVWFLSVWTSMPVLYAEPSIIEIRLGDIDDGLLTIMQSLLKIRCPNAQFSILDVTFHLVR